MTDRPTALITGASSGFGAAFARKLAAEGHDVVLVARRGQAMEELAQDVEERHGVEAIVLPKDLGQPDAARDVMENLRQRHHDRIDVLINSAGFTQFGRFAELPEDDTVELLQVNIVALVHLTRLVLPGMLERRKGIVVNLSSNAAFQPGPLMANYYASKTFVLDFSIALSQETKGSGVTVTALCPGPTATGFQARAAMEDSKLVAGKELPSADDVVEWGWELAKAGKPFAVHTTRWKAFALGTRLLPKTMAARMAMNAQERTGR
jgi:short-subunit dehydrogenase